ncbi:hypothetical protein [Bifidobacterium biavatii]|uniref:Uncharacterized protein n=1 Tax=Bifidobacterium biavatii DSM 23969 TaxID=1437608 RepID=A0A087A2U7_9BIFI|nr:hypothetical protein [Bifidobacterium biavatii]KFI53097.1 hypothetical protein BBIA_1073 [Bifidobacterium biavatii DSM 23969]
MSDVRRDQGDHLASGGMLPTVMLPLTESFDDDPSLSIHFVSGWPDDADEAGDAMAGESGSGAPQGDSDASSVPSSDTSGAPDAPDASALPVPDVRPGVSSDARPASLARAESESSDSEESESSDSIPTMPVDPADVVTAERAAVSSRMSGAADARLEETVPLKPLSDSGSAPVPPPPSFFPSNTTGRMRPIVVPMPPQQSRVVSGSSSFRPAQPDLSGANLSGTNRSGMKSKLGFVVAQPARAGVSTGVKPRVCYSSQYRVLHPAN